MPIPLTLTEKIATRYAVGLRPGQVARQGAIITIRPKHVMTHDNTSAVMGKFRELFKEMAPGEDQLAATRRLGAGERDDCGQASEREKTPRLHDPHQPVFAIDHDIQNLSPENLGKYAKIEAFAREHGIDFYPAGTGISHQVMVEYGYVTPGSMVVGSDSHSNLYGALCCLGTPVVRTDAASIWAIGTTWWQVPHVARCTLTGRLPLGVVGKDVIVALCGVFNNDEVLNMAVEFTGDGVARLSMDERLSIANMTTEWGALAGIFPADEVVREYLYSRADLFARRGDARPKYTRQNVDAMFEQDLAADAEAAYAVDLTLDLSTVIPHVSGPDHVKVMRSLPDVERDRIRIHKAYLLSCVNARLSDLHDAATVLRGRAVAEGVDLYVAAASAEVQNKAEQDGTWKTLLDAGAHALPPGCGTCIGLGAGTLEPGEVGISATNRNFKGRMGSREAQAYLASPAVVAASAAAGYICAPRRFDEVEPRFTLTIHPSPAGAEEETPILEGFPETATGRALWLPIDNLNTDGIYSGKLTYRDDVTPREMAAASMANYDPSFASMARPGDIIVSGANFGTGSSREQAATCLKHLGIRCVIAASFSETYKRNAFNNGFLVFECPDFVESLRAAHAGSKAPTIDAGRIIIDFRRSRLAHAGKTYAFLSPSETAQELIIAGGAEIVVTRRLAGAAGSAARAR